ncbi:unnamed protein product [Rhizoctonia solani]|uniref:Mid2 domain-containing protein n=1 Tax=Rhizoctonia solani TaxID=456999 RepID=A0A8H3DMT0_9AGAM|nr:unnamed protein product [Rhizoctonia solani]
MILAICPCPLASRGSNRPTDRAVDCLWKMTVFGRRVVPTRLLCTLMILMSTATGRAEERNATCLYNEQDGWGKLGESDKDVCSIAQAMMEGTCQSHVPALNTNTHLGLKNTWYTASMFQDDETLKSGLECACDRIMFNLLSACAGCQKWKWSNVTSTPITWQSFKTYQDRSCPSGAQKRAISRPWSPPPPAWALSFNQDTFDPTTVQNSTEPSPGPVNPSPSPSTANPAAETSPADGKFAQSTSSPGPAIGAIVGGVIGGLIFLGAIAGLAFWMYCRKRRARDVAPSAEFLKPEYYATPPLLPAHDRRDSAYRDEIEEEPGPSPTRRHSWVGGLVITRRHEEDDDDCEMLPPFTRGTYIGPSPHEKGYPERRDTGDTEITTHTNNTTTFLLSSPTRRHGTSEYFT